MNKGKNELGTLHDWCRMPSFKAISFSYNNVSIWIIHLLRKMRRKVSERFADAKTKGLAVTANCE